MNTLEILKALSDETRLRILFLLLYEPLHVNEILEILKMRQSRISRHLKILQDANILIAARDGARIFYGISPDFRLHPIYSAIMQIKDMNNNFWTDEIIQCFKKDQKNIFELMNKRKIDSISFFEKFGDLLETTQNQYVDSEFYRKKILELIPENVKICVEPGCGTGWISMEIVKKVNKLICIDQSKSSLDKLLERIHKDFLKKIITIPAEMENIPLKDNFSDLVVLSMALHHTANFHTVLKESYRILKTNGILIIAELDHHNKEEMRKKFADFWLGFPIEVLKKELENLNFKNLEIYKGKGKGILNCIFIKCTK